jgi:hypothetical protein
MALVAGGPPIGRWFSFGVFGDPSACLLDRGGYVPPQSFLYDCRLGALVGKGDGFDLLDCLGFELVHFFDGWGPRASGSGSFSSWHSSGLPMLEHDQGLVVEIKHYADDGAADGDVGGNDPED